MVESDSGAQDVPVHRNEVWHKGVDKEAGTVAVDVHAVLLQQLPLMSPTLRPILCQLVNLKRGRYTIS